MEVGIKIKVITLPEGSPLPYVPAFCEWTDHVKVCVQCERVDQLARAHRPFNPMDLCEGGAMLQLTVSRRINDQHKLSMWN